MKDYYKVKTSPKCREASVVKGEKYRITVLTEGLLRLEYSESGKFVDEECDLWAMCYYSNACL